MYIKRCSSYCKILWAKPVFPKTHKLQYKYATQNCHQLTAEIPFMIDWFQIYSK